MASHRSRLCAASIDVRRGDFDSATRFWQQSLRREAEIDGADPDYVSFGEVTAGVELMVQAVDDDPRIHLDIETDDVEAEVARLVAAGATEVERIESWVVMRDPVGIVFCVVRVQNPAAFEAAASTWST